MCFVRPPQCCYGGWRDAASRECGIGLLNEITHMEMLVLLFVATWVCGAAMVWFFWWMTVPWRLMPRLLLLSLVAAVFVAPSAVFSEGGGAPVPAIVLLIKANSWAMRLWGI